MAHQGGRLFPLQGRQPCTAPPGARAWATGARWPALRAASGCAPGPAAAACTVLRTAEMSATRKFACTSCPELRLSLQHWAALLHVDAHPAETDPTHCASRSSCCGCCTYCCTKARATAAGEALVSPNRHSSCCSTSKGEEGRSAGIEHRRQVRAADRWRPPQSANPAPHLSRLSGPVLKLQIERQEALGGALQAWCRPLAHPSFLKERQHRVLSHCVVLQPLQARAPQAANFRQSSSGRLGPQDRGSLALQMMLGSTARNAASLHHGAWDWSAAGRAALRSSAAATGPQPRLPSRHCSASSA